MKRQEDLVLAIDCGTQSLRALAFNPYGELIAKEKIEYQPYVSVHPGWAEQDPGIWYRALILACSRLANNSEVFKRIVAITVTSQRDSMICLDDKDEPLRPAILWMDTRKAHAPYIPRNVSRLGYRVIGMEESILRTQEAAACNWIRQNEAEIWSKTRHFVQVSGYLNHRLTSEYADAIASQIGHIPFDYRNQCWARAGHLNARMFFVEPEKLSTLVESGNQIGTITKKAAIETGLPAGLPVIAAGSDKGCETLGCAVIDSSRAALSFGTTATVQTTTERYIEPLRFMPAYPAPIPGRYNPEVEIFRGYWMISWFKNQFAYKEVLEAAKRGIPAEKMLDTLLEQTPCGAHGLVMQPYWTAGLKQPSAKGAIIGFGDVHERAHVYRSIIEGLAFGLREGLEAIQKRSGQKVTSLRVSGGASQSDSICKISADVMKIPIERGSTFESSGLGAAMCAASALGWYDSIPIASLAMAGKMTVFEPVKSNCNLYEELYRRVYKKMYRSLHHLYEEIRDISGYPERPRRASS